MANSNVLTGGNPCRFILPERIDAIRQQPISSCSKAHAIFWEYGMMQVSRFLIHGQMSRYFLVKYPAFNYFLGVIAMPDDPSKNRIGLKAVAIAAGVSRMTVSLALRNHNSLPPATRERIQSIAKQLGYQPDPDMGKLMEKIRERKKGHNTSVIAYITAHETKHGWKNSFTQASYYEGARARAIECGYQLDVFWLREPKMTEERLSEILRNRGVDGVLIAPIANARLLYARFRWDYFSAVELGYSVLNLNLCRCSNHQFQSMMLLIQRIQQAGYQRIGLAMPVAQDKRANNNWRAAYLAGLSLKSDRQSIPMLLSENWSKNEFVRWFKKYRPDAIVTISSDVQKWLSDLKIDVPNDVGVANVDLSVDLGETTGIDQNSVVVGASAVDFLITLMRSNERGLPRFPKILMVEGVFVQGTTTLPVRDQ